ncbi:hypothetical protein SRABI118_00360 [Massilia sp. Bi118]|uniref:PEP-CTERM sorting domain-containing protein n=1 Tax=Massilia sp. Bi118 TaxID=2822346 RepID=UPI001D8AECF0|nr:PEP-CTERM sorting domain-containing protein [Massilia sp. Bi118]CAH0144117.1 hypothetical protein SRABI118_00360 [Massilia sp. Bi118]
MKKIIMETLVLAALATGQAYLQPVHAAPISLDRTTVTATYQGSADGILGLDHGFQAEPGSNVSKVYAPGAGVEFLTADYLFGFDFAADGLLTVYNNMPLPERAAGDPGYTFSFDFGATLPAPVGSFTLVDGSMVNGAPGLSVVDGHTLALDLSKVTWNGDFASFTAQIGTGAGDVPEPASLALLLLGAAGLAAASKRRTR